MNKVQEIHDAIDTAADRLLVEAKSIIDSGINMSNKAERLANAGFHGSEIVKKFAPIVKTRELAELINYHKATYPFYKFITEAEMERICKKYNLIFAPISRYKKDVPEKNLIHIEKMSELNKSDIRKVEHISTINYNGILSPGNFRARLMGLPKKVNEEFSSWIDADRYLKENYPIIRNRGCVANSVKCISIDKSGLFIAAPKSHFNLIGLKQFNSGFLNFTVTEIKDPIVFRYVRGGIQVITKWGLEASDETLLNEINN